MRKEEKERKRKRGPGGGEAREGGGKEGTGLKWQGYRGRTSWRREDHEPEKFKVGWKESGCSGIGICDAEHLEASVCFGVLRDTPVSHSRVSLDLMMHH